MEKIGQLKLSIFCWGNNWSLIYITWSLFIFLLCHSNDTDGQWEEVFQKADLIDSRHQGDPLPLKSYNFCAINTRYVKFQLTSWYGSGGGLQYFNAKYSEDTTTKPPLTGKGTDY